MAENPWTQELVDQITRLWNDEGLSAGRIAAEMKMTRNMIIGKARRLNLVKREQGKPAGPAIKRKYPKHRAPAIRIAIPRIKPEPYLVQVADVEPLHIDIMQLTDTSCRYPLGDGPFTYCGHSVKTGSSYCPAHHAICFYTPQKVRRDVRPAPYPWKAQHKFSGAWA